MKRIMCASAFFIVLVLGTFVCALGGPLPDTGQTKCYDNSVEITCPQPGEDFYGQDGSYLINPPSYTKLDAEGNDLPDSAIVWFMVRDNVTGLIWEAKRNDGSIHDKDNLYTWQNAQDVFIAQVNGEKFGGHSDWRMPTPKEFQSIANLGNIGPSVNTTFFPKCRSSYNYWSGSTNAHYSDDAWDVDFGDGDVNNGNKTNYRYVRCVRAGPSGSLDHFALNGDGTVTDTATGLMWQQEAPGTDYAWEGSLTYAENLVLAEYDDWRLPNARELQSIVDYSEYSPAINTNYFPDCRSSYYWSSTPRANNTGSAWSVSFGYGYVFCRYKTSLRYVRCVRAGQCRLLGHLIISTPTQGSVWKVGDTMSITWENQGIAGNVKISISRQGGKVDTFETIVDSTANDGSYNWTVVGAGSFNCVLKIEPITDLTKGTTQGLFTVYGVPTAAAAAATSVTSTSATLNGTVNPNAASTTVVFEWGADDGYGNEATATQSPITGITAQSASASLTGLTPVTTYHYRVTATNSAGTAYGSDLTFTTSPIIPTVTTTAISSITANSSSSGGNVTSNGGASVTDRGVCWSTSANPTTSNSKTTDSTGTGSFTSSITGLTPVTTYHVRAYATNSAGTSYGSDLTFTTSTTTPTVTTTVASSITSTSASSGGNVISNGGASITARGVCWSTSANPTTDDYITTDGTDTGSFTSSITGLTPVTTYHVRAYATNSVGTTYGSDLTFTTSTTTPTVTTTEVSSVTSTTATSGGNVTADGGASITAKGVCWGTSANPTISNSKTTDGTGTGTFTSNIEGLNPNTTYHVRAYATNSQGTAYGSDITFTTPTATPTVTTTASSSITTSTASSGGNVTSDGGATVTTRGVCWSTSTNPTTSDSKTTDSTGTGSFTSSITGLTPVTTYHVRAYATNSAGTSYGSDQTFTTTSSGMDILYVSSDGTCGGNTPCYITIQEAIDAAETGSVIKILQGTYDEDIIIDQTYDLTLSGGWDSTFTTQSSNTVINSLTITGTGGTVQINNIVLQ